MFRIVSVTALLISMGLAIPVRADVVRQSNEQHTIQRSRDRDRYDWEWDRRRDDDSIERYERHDRRPDDNQRIEIRVNRRDRDGERRERDRDWNRRDRDDYSYDDIDRIYQEVLGRSAQSNEVRTYSRRLEKGDSLRDIRSKIAGSGEARDLVKDIYREITGNNASRSTISNYTRRLADGWTLGDVEDDIAEL